MDNLKEGIVVRVLPRNRALVEPIDERGNRRLMLDTNGTRVTESERVYYDEETNTLVNVITYKADVWRRATESEAETLFNVLESLPVKKKMLFKDAMYLNHLDADFAEIKTLVSEALGETRANEILEPSNSNESR